MDVRLAGICIPLETLELSDAPCLKLGSRIQSISVIAFGEFVLRFLCIQSSTSVP